jgi:hypothetical protein
MHTSYFMRLVLNELVYRITTGSLSTWLFSQEPPSMARSDDGCWQQDAPKVPLSSTGLNLCPLPGSKHGRTIFSVQFLEPSLSAGATRISFRWACLSCWSYWLCTWSSKPWAAGLSLLRSYYNSSIGSLCVWFLYANFVGQGLLARSIHD